MGRDKALLPHGEQSQLAHLMQILHALLPKVFVSARAEQQDEAERSRFPQIIDRYRDLGPVAGILSAMDEHPAADWLVVACDLPNLDAATISYLVERRSPDKPFTAYLSSHDGLPEPLCAVYRADSAAIVRAFVADGLHCPRKMLIRSETELLQQPDPGSLDNINTPDDLRGSRLGGAA
ncbi:MAG: NTP transferase domain-containing protein [Woeseiaceae bacterium]|nr:NTP transferase domain-containing protein [Woeseiaceae bacterium]